MDLFEYMCVRGEPQAHRLARSLSGDHTLRILDLSGSAFGVNGVAYICRALCFNKTLRRLILTSALRDTDDAIALYCRVRACVLPCNNDCRNALMELLSVGCMNVC